MVTLRCALRPAFATLHAACLLAWSATWASDQPPAERIEILSAAAADDTRDATAARRIVSRQDIVRHGDSALVDVLRRVPGITITGNGRAADVRLRGLGNGYTQLLVNGEVMPAGFSLDGIAPSQVERIEVARVATVDVGAQAIAGTVNIILRQAQRQAQRELKAGVAANAGRGSAQLDGQFSDRFEHLSYALGAVLSRRNEAWPSTLLQRATDASGATVLERRIERQAVGHADALGLTPKLVLQWGEGDKLSLEALQRHSRFDDPSIDVRSALLGPPPDDAATTQGLHLRTRLAQTRLGWQHTLAGGGTVDSRLGINRLQRDADTRLRGLDGLQATTREEQVVSVTIERGSTASGKLRLPYTEAHAVALGWDGEHTTRAESRVQRQHSPIGRPVLDLDERYETTLRRLALYAQDEWDLDEALSAYLGVRWTLLRTRTQGEALAPVGQRAIVFSPVLQLLWKPRALPGDQARLALSRTTKAPRAADLLPRRYVATDNTPTTPDIQGNPSLRPELAWGVDLAWEHMLPAQAGSVNVSASARRIRDVILDQLRLDGRGWVSSKANDGGARVFGLELDAQLRLRKLWSRAPDLEVRGGLALNRSRIDRVAGPDNRLDSQVPLSATLGLDGRVAGLPLTLGLSLAHRAGVLARTSATQTITTAATDTLDLVATWRFGPQLLGRLAVANALSQGESGTELYTDAVGSFGQGTASPARPTVRATLEMNF